jgi:serine/threonine protein kinase
MTRTLVEKLWLPFDSVKTLYEGSSEVRLYRNDITGVKQIGKRVSAVGIEQAVVFREATLLQSIRHDHIVPVYDVAVVDDPAVDKQLKVIEMILPYYERGSAWDAVQRGDQFSVGEAVRLTREALTGLNELHERYRLLHRDIKSGNVFLDDSGRMRVGDLGVAVPMDDDGTAEMFEAAQIYSPPESLTAQRCDRRTDIYGIGLLLFELLNGSLPYAQYDRSSIVRRLEKARRPVLDEHLHCKPHVPPRLRQIVKKAISRKPRDRYANGREMMDALDKAPFIDWKLVEAKPDRIVWEGALGGGERSYRVTADKYQRRDDWNLAGLQRVTRWQRFVDDQVVKDPTDDEARDFFDNVLKQAASR